MGIRLGAHGRVETPAHGPACALLTILLLAAVVGCGTRHAEQAPASTQTPAGAQAPAGAQPEGETPASPTVAASAHETVIQLPAPRHAGPIHRILLSEQGCIRFEPQWTTVRVGQSLTWHSELRSPVRIYVSPGAFDKESYLIRPGATISTGAARARGRYVFWTRPAACRNMPRGVLLAGPGVRVQDTYYASNPGPR